MGRTTIEWVRGDDGTPGDTWNPLLGCSAVSPGCEHCYAERQTGGRLRNIPAYKGLTDEHGKWTGEVRLIPERLDIPVRQRRPRRIFVNSMSDLFHPAVKPKDIADVFASMAMAPQHQFQILTKRPQAMAALLNLETHRPGGNGGGWVWSLHDKMLDRIGARYGSLENDNRGEEWPLPNVWLGTSIESQIYAWRARHLLETPAAIRFISAEPLIGPLDLTSYLTPQEYPTGIFTGPPIGPGLDWVIVGGESGPGARPMREEWVRDLKDQCDAADVSFLFKQAGIVLGREWGCPDSHGADMNYFPEDLRVREYPR